MGKDFGYFGKGLDGYQQYKNAFDRNFEKDDFDEEFDEEDFDDDFDE